VAAKSKDKASQRDIQRTPMLIPELKQIKLLAAGGNHIIALDHKGKVFTWGCGEQNQLGRRIVSRTRENALVPSEFGLSKRKIKGISCGAFHSFAVDGQGRVFTWGLNNFGQTGITNGAGESNAIIGTPTIVESLRNFNIKEIRGGNHHSVACTQDQKLLVWGRCDDAQIGIPTTKLPRTALIFNSQNKPRILSEPTVIPGNIILSASKKLLLTIIGVSAVVVAAGIDNSIAINEEGKAYSWGFSANYRTGLGTDDSIEEPTQLQNSALIGKKLTFAGCGGQFSVLAGPAVNGI
jgi:regulator of chromosome condensation